MSSLFNRARVSTATAGTGTMTLGAATSNAFFTFAEAGVPNATVVSYVIEDGNDVELGVGTYTTAGTTLSRTTVTASKIGGVAGTTKLTLSGSAIVYIDALAADITVPPASSTDNTIARYDGTTGRAIQGTAVVIDDSNVMSNMTKLFVNDTVDRSLDAFATQFQMSCDPSLAWTATFLAYGNVAGQAAMGFAKSRSAAGGQTIVNAGDTLTSLDFYGSDGVNFEASSDIMAVIDGTPGVNDMPGKLLFLTRSVGTSAPVRWVGIRQNGYVQIDNSNGATTPDRRLHVEEDSATTNAVTYVERLTSTSSGTPANGIGVGMEFEVEAQAGVNKVGATIEAVAWDTSAASEDFALVFKTMSAGAAATEEMRTGFAPTALIQPDSIVMRANYGKVVPEFYEIAAGVTLELGAGAIMEITG